MRTIIVRIIISVCCFAIIAQAQNSSVQNTRFPEMAPHTSRASRIHELDLNPAEKDFLLPGEGFTNRKATIGYANVPRSSANNIISSGFPVESVVQYKSFAFGTTFSLHAFSGKYVSYLMSDSMIAANGLSQEDIRQLVDLTDLLYAHMKEIVGGEPSGDGLLTIALINPGYDFGAKGWVGMKGVEMYEGYAARYRKDFLAGCAPAPVVHEMSHNFDIYNAYISHDGNNVHAWTSFLIPYSQYYTHAGGSWNGRVVQPETLLDQTIAVDLDPWNAAGASVSWNDCVKTGAGCPDKGIYANETWGGIVLRYARLHSPTAVRRAFRFLSAYKAAHSTPPGTAEAKNDVLLSAFAAGAESDVACELNAWNWPVSAEAAGRMKTAYPNQNYFCSDVDNDGYSPATGDRDDFNSTIRPGAIDTTNGLDDDCDGIVDDLPLSEVEDVPAGAHSASRVTIPGHVIGHTATAADSDSYQIEIDTPRSINIWAKGMGKSFSGWFELRYAGDPETMAPLYLSYEFPAGTVVPFERAGTWILTVMPWLGADEGYELFFSEIQTVPTPQVRIVSTPRTAVLTVYVTVAENALKGSWPTEVKLWAEGLGFIAQQRFQPVTVFKWKLPSGNPNIRLRAQLSSNDSPVSNVTTPIPVEAANTTTSQNTRNDAGPKSTAPPTIVSRVASKPRVRSRKFALREE